MSHWATPRLNIYHFPVKWTILLPWHIQPSIFPTKCTCSARPQYLPASLPNTLAARYTMWRAFDKTPWPPDCWLTWLKRQNFGVGKLAAMNAKRATWKRRKTSKHSAMPVGWFWMRLSYCTQLCLTHTTCVTCTRRKSCVSSPYACSKLWAATST